jgi:hypothetical protein
MILLACFLIALIAISMTAVLPDIVGQIRHDKEVEMIHRGVQYTRAIKKYNTKTGGYPLSIDQLLETNHIRFLRQRYKDPITGKDFRLLRMSDPEVIAAVASVGGLTGAMGAVAGGTAQSQQAMMLGALAGGMSSNSQIPGAQSVSDLANAQASATPSDQPAQPSASPSSTPSSPFSSGISGSSPFGGSTSGTSASGTSTIGGQTFGGGPFIGVASTSKKKGFHIFNKKEHYNEWLFIYQSNLYQNYPATYLIRTPFNGLLNLPGSNIPGANPLGQPAATPTPPSGGFNTGFGSSFGSSGNSFGGNNPSSQPPSNPSQ